MKSYDAKGMMAFWTDIDDENLLEVQKWHNCEHMTERVSIPGFIVGRRYRGVDDAPTFFITYETRDTDVLQSDAYLQALNNSTPWTKHALTFFKNNIRNIYSRVAVTGTAAATEAPYNYVLRFNIDADDEEPGLDRLKADYLPEIAALPDVICSRFYEIDEKISNIKTGEREIYGGGPGRQRYLLIVETATQYASRADDWQQVNTKYSDLLSGLSDRYEEHSFLEFVMYSPDHN
jgi:hypothetical protein